MHNNRNARSNGTERSTEKKPGEMRKRINYVRCLQWDLAVSLENNQRAKHPIVMRLPQSKASGCTQGSSPEGQREDLQEGRGSISGKKHVQGVPPLVPWQWEGVPSWYPSSWRVCPLGIWAVGRRALLVPRQWEVVHALLVPRQWEGVPSWYFSSGSCCLRLQMSVNQSANEQR